MRRRCAAYLTVRAKADLVTSAMRYDNDMTRFNVTSDQGTFRTKQCWSAMVIAHDTQSPNLDTEGEPVSYLTKVRVGEQRDDDSEDGSAGSRVLDERSPRKESGKGN